MAMASEPGGSKIAAIALLLGAQVGELTVALLGMPTGFVV